ncbi:MAG: hypothetical protein ACE5HS_22635, partial [bacterium]
MTNGTANFVDLIHSITNRHFKRSSKSLFILTLLLLFDQQSTFAQFRERPPIPIPDKTISVGIRNDYFNTPGLDQV